MEVKALGKFLLFEYPLLKTSDYSVLLLTFRNKTQNYST